MNIILDRFMINSFVQKELEEFRWYEVAFDSEIKSNILYIHFNGEYYGAYTNRIDEQLFFDLKTGDALINQEIPFQALFTLDGYLDFMQKYWLPGAKKAFQEAIQCADKLEPYCSYYDITSYNFDGHSLSAGLTPDCYPHALQACDPEYGDIVREDSIKPLLNAFGKKVLFEDHYTDLKGIDRYLYNEKTKSQLVHHVFLFGTIGEKYPFSMAVTLDKAKGIASGYYYYDKKRIKIKLEGKTNSSQLKLTETDQEVRTGQFDFEWDATHTENSFTLYIKEDEYIYLRGLWSNPDRSKVLQVVLKEVVLTQPHW